MSEYLLNQENSCKTLRIYNMLKAHFDTEHKSCDINSGQMVSSLLVLWLG